MSEGRSAALWPVLTLAGKALSVSLALGLILAGGRWEDTAGMHLGRREDEDQGPTRVVVWSDDSQTDVGVLVAATIAAVVFIASVVAAISFGGIVQVIAIVLAVLSGLYSAVIVIPLLVVRGLFRRFRRLE